MKEMLENRLAAKKEELKKKQEYFQIGIQNINSLVMRIMQLMICYI